MGKSAADRYIDEEQAQRGVLEPGARPEIVELLRQEQR